MINKLQITAETLSIAKEKLLEEIPNGFFLISMIETGPRKMSTKASSETINEALNQVRKGIPSNISNTKEEIVREPRKANVEVIAFDSEQAKRRAVRSEESVDIKKVELVKKGSQGLFGFGKKPNEYNVELFYQAIVEIYYEYPAEIIAEITDDRDIANDKYLDFSEKGNVEMVKFLVQQGVDKNVCDSNGANALMLSAFSGKTEISMFLIFSGIDINHKDHRGFNALMLACESPKADIELVKTLIDKGANINAISDRGATALMAAAKIGHNDIVEILVSNGADINARNFDHNITPLIWAASGGHSYIVKFLLRNGADRNIRTYNNYTAATIAKENGHYSIVEILNR